MSIKNKLLDAARAGMMDERGRVLWLIDQIEEELKAGLQKKLLIESQRHTIEVKIKIFQALASKLRRGIVSGVRPEGGETNGSPPVGV